MKWLDFALKSVSVEDVEMQNTQPQDLVLRGVLLGLCLPVIIALTLLACVKGLEVITESQDGRIGNNSRDHLSA